MALRDWMLLIPPLRRLPHSSTIPYGQGSGQGGSPARGPILIFDTFTGTNGTDLINHTPDIDTPGSPWFKYSGQVAGIINIQNNQAQCSVASNIYYGIDATQANVTVSADVATNVLTTYSGLTLRQDASNNGWLALIRPGSPVQIILVQNQAGSNTIRASKSVTITASVFYTITFSGSGQSVKFTLSGGDLATPAVLTYNAATFNQNVTTHGMGITKGPGVTVVQVDNFKITAP